MSQPGRQDFSDKAEAKFKPDSQKTFTEHVGDMATGKLDNLGSTVQPQQDKSMAQKAGDAMSGQQNHNPGERSLMDKAKDAVGLGDKHSTNREL
ncbi:hypothetical protein M408DRAFT_17494 [Serendipita vermifera MAFF 305830]|uniref:Heat shock protein 9/12 n=1 Tax=Serendipita vermifera MAFF 305830 TaxID=933852 RepID=A0A0C3B023_SERVB|nr:hypothetical protein M408DRAFT_17494 [Serendipita vermifera MAFF 305830]